MQVNWIKLKEDISMYVITDACVSCGSCAMGCPAEAISHGEDHYEIDQDLCLQCGSCADSCPTSAIEEQ